MQRAVRGAHAEHPSLLGLDRRPCVVADASGEPLGQPSEPVDVVEQPGEGLDLLCVADAVGGRFQVELSGPAEFSAADLPSYVVAALEPVG